MANTRSYIPRGDGPSLEFAKNLYAYALINFDRWNVPSPRAVLMRFRPLTKRNSRRRGTPTGAKWTR
jgi:hypothetical protein